MTNESTTVCCTLLKTTAVTMLEKPTAFVHYVTAKVCQLDASAAVYQRICPAQLCAGIVIQRQNLTRSLRNRDALPAGERLQRRQRHRAAVAACQASCRTEC
jgi:hypothetical protein